MFLLLVLPILVSGFIFVNQHPVIFYKLHRYEGQYLYLQSAKYGLFCLIAAFFLNKPIQWALHLPTKICGINIGPDYITFLSEYFTQHKIVEQYPIQAAWIVSISTIMLLIPYIYCICYKIYRRISDDFPSESKLLTAIQYEILKDSPMDKMLLLSLIQQKQILISMNDRKVYVGVVTSTSEPNESDGANQEISIKPILSGVRDKDNLTVEFTTDYKDLNVDVSLTIKQELIVSATDFSFEVYEEFKKRKIKEPTSNKLITDVVKLASDIFVLLKK